MRGARQLRVLAAVLGIAAAGPASAQAPDPFAGVSDAPPAETAPAPSWISRFFTDNFGFRKEIMSEFDTSQDGDPASRQSIGFEALKKFSTSTSTVASFDFQARLVRRDGYNPVLNDMEGAARPGWAFEYHNLYLDLYNVVKPVGRVNFRVGHFYVPFGLNLQTDTHGTVLQLSNESNFGFERDWYAGFWGSINKHLNYDAYYMAGSGYDLKFKGQSGLAAVRLSLSNRYSSEYRLEGGVSLIGGERLARLMNDGRDTPLKTQRVGVDTRYRHTAPHGLLTFTTELSGGRDAVDPVFTQLHQAEYLRASRRWGVASQFRRFFQEGRETSASMIGEFSWYFRNDVANSNSHWLKLNVERQLHSVAGPPQTIVTLQYYLYR
jgi:hypothetical protein